MSKNRDNLEENFVYIQKSSRVHKEWEKAVPAVLSLNSTQLAKWTSWAMTIQNEALMLAPKNFTLNPVISNQSDAQSNLNRAE